MVQTPSIPQNLIDELNAASKKLEKPSQPNGGLMTIVYAAKGAESPLAVAPAGKEAYSGDYWGTFSLEKFADAGSLSYTHEDAWGWLEYLEKFQPRNFRYLDENVRIWAYYEDYDNWQDTYGMDAVLAVYHSGHGGMTSDGKFHVPLGADWGGQGTTAWSDQMRLGNEQARYIFWSTCLSCRVLGGHNPIRTWSPANLGFRLLFGYETVSYDDPNYGSAFWKHWNQGKSFSTAFLDASWYDVSHNQAPAVVACGATEEEAKDRLFNERLFYWDAVQTSWWWWRWYYAANAATLSRSLNQKLPQELLVAELEPSTVDSNYVSSILAKYNLGIAMPQQVLASPNGIFYFKEGERRLSFESDGSYEIAFARPNRDNPNQISLSMAADLARNFVRQQGLEQEGLILNGIRLGCEAGASKAESNSLKGPYVTETVVEFTQVINDLPVLLPGKGSISVSIDNDGRVTGIRNSTRRIARLTDRPKNSPMAPGEAQPFSASLNPERLLADAWQERMRDWLVRGRMPVSYSVVPGTYEIGYAIKGNEAILVARNDIEVDCGGGYLKRYAVEVPLLQ
jgi:hypothetical protein